MLDIMAIQTAVKTAYKIKKYKTKLLEIKQNEK